MSETSFMARFLAEMRILVSHLPEQIETVDQFPDLGLRSLLYGGDAPFCEQLPGTEEGEEVVRIWLIRDRYNCRYILTIRPGYTERWMIGPYLLEDMSMTDITRLFQKLGMPQADMYALRQFYLSLPRIRDENMLDALVNVNCITRYGSTGYEISYWRLEPELQPTPVLPKPDYSEQVRSSMEQRYATERQMIECISRGNDHGASMAIKKLSGRARDQRAGSTLRDRKNYTIIFNTLCRVAAERGRVPALLIDKYSGQFALEIEGAASSNEIRVLRDRMLRDYCGLVRETKNEHYVPLVRRAIDVISADLTVAVSLSSVADRLNISPNYLSALFKKETGKTFTEFLVEERLRYAKQLLVQTNQSVGEIAEACGIPDQNYFARVFKSREHMTPVQFRNQNSGRFVKES